MGKAETPSTECKTANTRNRRVGNQRLAGGADPMIKKFRKFQHNVDFLKVAIN